MDFYTFMENLKLPKCVKYNRQKCAKYDRQKCAKYNMQNVQNIICKNIKSIQNEVLVIGFNGRNKLCSFYFFDYVNKNMKLCKKFFQLFK